MLLKKEVKTNIIKALYDSTNLLSSVYDTNSHDLILIFKSGTQYKYPNVSSSDYTRLEIAESQGVVFNTHIKKYPYERLENVNAQEIIVEATTIKTHEQEAFEKGKRIKLIQLMNSIISLDGMSPFDKVKFSEELKKLYATIKDFF